MPTSRDTAKVIEFTNVAEAPRRADIRSRTVPTAEPVGLDAAGDLTIDCDCCTLRDTAACDDCVVSFLLEREPEDAVVIDADEARAMRMLERAGLVPTLRFSPELAERAGRRPGRTTRRWPAVKRHLLVTNDFPPKVGGIQNYLWDLWSRLDPASFVVLTASSDDGAAAFDAAQAERGIRIERVPGKHPLLPDA